jgi:hypothetical protein
MPNGVNTVVKAIEIEYEKCDNTFEIYYPSKSVFLLQWEQLVQD